MRHPLLQDVQAIGQPSTGVAFQSESRVGQVSDSSASNEVAQAAGEQNPLKSRSQDSFGGQSPVAFDPAELSIFSGPPPQTNAGGDSQEVAETTVTNAATDSGFAKETQMPLPIWIYLASVLVGAALFGLLYFFLRPRKRKKSSRSSSRRSASTNAHKGVARSLASIDSASRDEPVWPIDAVSGDEMFENGAAEVFADDDVFDVADESERESPELQPQAIDEDDELIDFGSEENGGFLEIDMDQGELVDSVEEGNDFELDENAAMAFGPIGEAIVIDAADVGADADESKDQARRTHALASSQPVEDLPQSSSDALLALRQEVEALESQLEDLTSERLSQAASHQKQVLGLEKEVAALSEQLEAANAEIAAAKVDSRVSDLESEIQEYKSQLEEAVCQREALTKKVESNENETEQFQLTIAKLEKEAKRTSAVADSKMGVSAQEHERVKKHLQAAKLHALELEKLLESRREESGTES